MNRAELRARYAAGPAKLRESLAGLTEADLSYKYDPKKWSIREIAIHAADMDLSGAFRIKRVAAEPNPAYPGVDQDLWANHLGYQERPVEPSLLMLEGIRGEVSGLLARLDESSWARTGVHSEAGQQTLAGLVEGFTNHLEKHIEQIRAIRERLGK